MILLATEQLEQSKRMALTMADVMNLCSELTRESQVIRDNLEALLKRMTAVDAMDNVVAFPYRSSVQQMLQHPTHVAQVSAAGQTANDLHLTLTRHLLVQSHRVTYLTSDDVTNCVTQGRTPRILGLSNEAYALDHSEWLTASAETIARIRSDRPQRQFTLAVLIFRLYTPTVIGRAIRITPDKGDRALSVDIVLTVQ
jgi:hypothetical protein